MELLFVILMFLAADFDGCPYLVPNPETRLPFVSIKHRFHDLYDRDGDVMLSSTTVAPGQTLEGRSVRLLRYSVLQVRSGASGAPVNQVGARHPGLQTVPA